MDSDRSRPGEEEGHVTGNLSERSRGFDTLPVEAQPASRKLVLPGRRQRRSRSVDGGCRSLVSQPRYFPKAGAFDVPKSGAASARPPWARSRRLGRGPGSRQRHGMDRQGTCEIPLASTRATAGESGTPANKYVPGLGRPSREPGAPRGEYEQGRNAWDPRPNKIRKWECAGGKS